MISSVSWQAYRTTSPSPTAAQVRSAGEFIGRSPTRNRRVSLLAARRSWGSSVAPLLAIELPASQRSEDPWLCDPGFHRVCPFIVDARLICQHTRKYTNRQ